MKINLNASLDLYEGGHPNDADDCKDFEAAYRGAAAVYGNAIGREIRITTDPTDPDDGSEIVSQVYQDLHELLFLDDKYGWNYDDDDVKDRARYRFPCRIEATFSPDGETTIDCTQAEVLGDAHGRRYTREEAESIAYDLRAELKDTDIHPSTKYHVEPPTPDW